MKLPLLRCLKLGTLVIIAVGSAGFMPPADAPLPNFDQRQPAAAQSTAAGNTSEAGLNVSRDPITGAPRWVTATSGFLTGPTKSASAKTSATLIPADPHQVVRTFINEHPALFGHDATALDAAQITREFTTAHNGLHTVVWQQQVDGIKLFEAVLIAHTTSKGELVNIASQFIPNPVSAADAGLASRAATQAAPPIAVTAAIQFAAKNVGEMINPALIAAADAPAGSEQKQTFSTSELPDEARARLVWLPMSAAKLRLCWEIELTSRKQDAMFRLLVDAVSGKVMLRHCLTAHISDATYNVFTSDSPSPFSPGHATPLTNQPALVSRTLVTLPALNTNASPAGWINDGGNETLGNNVDAHTDLDNDNVADLPRPQGSPFRVFDFPMNLDTQDPTNYSAAAVVQLFYWCNWMHDKLYALGFTEAAGNFQADNFGHDGAGNDRLLADAQDGGGLNNANMSTPGDGSSPRMQMYIFSGPTPRRDGDLDAEIILHEYAHGLSNRRVGGGVGISALQTSGMGEGWSDFYALALLSEPGDDVNGNYALGGYATDRFFGLTQNYYYGIRRYPYSTDMAKNPLTFKDIDPVQASTHTGVPRSPVAGSGGAAAVHNQGEVWCATLWEARANLINKSGFATGNQLILQLVTDGMKLSPVNPTFLEARDAIIQADLVYTGGTNFNDLWAAFAKRGMGYEATSPGSSTTTGVLETFDLPEDLRVSPLASSPVMSGGPAGGPFDVTSQNYTLTNAGSAALNWTVASTVTWLGVAPTGGTLQPGATTNILASLNASANALAVGAYPATLQFTNMSNGLSHPRSFTVKVRPANFYTRVFALDDFDLDHSSLTFTPDGGTNFYSICRMAAGNFPTDPAGGTPLALSDDTAVTVTLTGTNTIQLYNRRTNTFFVGSNGYLTFGAGDSSNEPSPDNHFALPRVAALLQDLNPDAGGSITSRELSNRVAITWQGVPLYGTNTPNDLQIEMFYDGRIRFTFLTMSTLNGLTGLSDGFGTPAGFVEDDLSSRGSCSNQAPAIVTQPASQTAAIGSTVTFNSGASGSVPMTYQWKFKGTNLPDATNATLVLVGVATNQAGTYALAATNAFSFAVSSNATLTVLPPVTLAQALDTTNLTWTTGGSADWTGQFTTTHDGTDAAQSGMIGNLQESWLQTTVTNGPGTLTFWWKVSSGAGFDFLEFYTNSVLQSGRISGETGWQQKTYYLPGGAQILRWRYVKDQLVIEGQDKAWVDEVSFVPDVPLRFLPLQSTSNSLQINLVATNGSVLGSGQAGRIQFYSSTNPALVFSNWTLVTNTLTFTNGMLRLNALTTTNPAQRYFRARQNP